MLHSASKIIHLSCCGEEIQDRAKLECQDCGPGITVQEEPELSLVGSDVKALFPSIKSENTGKIIREAVENTSMEFQGYNIEKALAYVAMNTELTTDLEEIAYLLPKRKSGRSTKLKMSALEKDWKPHDKFEYKNTELSSQECKKILARVAEIATRALFQNHAYRFGDEYYHQKEGGSIGDRWTGAASEIVMQDWATKYRNILENSKLEVHLLAGYVDDGRQYTSCLPLGSRFQEQTGTFQTSKQAEAEDIKNKNNGESTNQRMARVCITAMNSINKDLEFTVETPEDFPEEKLPTLDFKIWQERDQSLNHCYYQKEVKTPYVVMARSGMAGQQKISILANELTRRLSNINLENSEKFQYIQVTNQYTQELKNSEYPYRTAKEIIISGLRGLQTKIKLRKIKNQEFYRSAHSTASQRAKKKLVSKENWYKQQETQENSCGQENTKENARKGVPEKPETSSKKNKNQESKIKAVMFVPFTQGSELAKLLRENEENLVKLTGSKVKIVERTGTKIQDLLTRSNPWKGHDCQRENCLLCFTKLRTENNKTQDCHQRNIVYETRCLTCQEQEIGRIENLEISEKEKTELKNKIKLFKYIGESSRSSFERGWEHLNDLTSLSNKSHMLKHILIEHQEQEISEIKFGMKILKTCRTSFERQIYESVAIQQNRQEHVILNSRAEYNRCSLPRLRTQLGENEYKEYSSEVLEEQKQEEELDKKIRMLRKTKNKERLVPVKGEFRGTKRRKIDENKYISIQETWGQPTRTVATKKQAEDTEQVHTNKKMRTTTPQRTIKLSNIRTLENKVVQGPVDTKILGWEEPRDWNKVLAEHKSRIEKEEQDRNKQLELQRRKIEGWQLYNTCKDYLENNDKFWKQKKEERIEENKRQERLHLARLRTRISLNKHENKRWEEKLRDGLNILPKEQQQQEELRTHKEEKMELKTAKENLWKLRGKENKLVETENVKKIRKLEKKTERVLELLEKEKGRLLSREQQLRTSIKNKENKIKKQELLAEVWATYRWITEFLSTTTQEWEQKKQHREQEERTRIEAWEQQTRKEKINNLLDQEKQQQPEQHEFLAKTIINEMLASIFQETTEPNCTETTEVKETTNVEVNKNDGTKPEQQTTSILLNPAKFKLKQTETSANKQQKIDKFFKQQEKVGNFKKHQPDPNADKQQIPTNNKKMKTKQTKKNNNNDQQSKKTTKQYKGYWANLAIKQKKQKEEKETTSQEQKTTESGKHNNARNSSLEAVTLNKILNLEASPNHEASHSDVTRGKVLEHSMILESDQIRSPVIEKGKQITAKFPT